MHPILQVSILRGYSVLFLLIIPRLLWDTTGNTLLLIELDCKASPSSSTRNSLLKARRYSSFRHVYGDLVNFRTCVLDHRTQPNFCWNAKLVFHFAMNSSEKKTNSLYLYIWFHHFPSQFDIIWSGKWAWTQTFLSQACVSAAISEWSLGLKSTAFSNFKLWNNILIG